MRRWIAQTGLSHVTLVAGIEVGASFDGAPDRAFRALAGFIDGASRSCRQIVVTRSGHLAEHRLGTPGKDRLTAGPHGGRDLRRAPASARASGAGRASAVSCAARGPR